MDDAYQCTICKCNAKLYTDKDGVFIKAVGEHIPKDANIKLPVTHLHTFTVMFFMLLNTPAFEYFFHAFETLFRAFEWPP